MKRINLSGVVGWEITDRLVNSLLPKNSNEDVEVYIQSYGGDAFEGSAIYNSLKSYPGKVKTIIKGIAASAAGEIFLAGDTRAVYKNSTAMFHPAWACCCGEGDILMSRGKMLNDLTMITAEQLSEITGGKKEDLYNELKNEKWVVGWEQLTDTGLADELIDDDPIDDETNEPIQAEPLEEMQNKVKAVIDDMQTKTKEESFENIVEKAAALISKTKQDSTPHGEKINTEENSMDKTKLKAEAPELYQEILDEGKNSVDVNAANETAVKAALENTATLLKLAGVAEETIKAATSGMSAGDFAIAEVEKRNEIQAAAGSNDLENGLKAGNQIPGDSKVDEDKDPLDDAVDNYATAKYGKGGE